MPTVITLNLRRDCRTDGRFVRAYSEEVDLDDLTPRARALAEAIHACPGHQPLGIRIATGILVRDTLNFRYIHGEGPVADAKGEEPETVVVWNWSVMRADSPMSAVEWLEREVRTIPLDACPVGPVGGDPVPSMQAGAADRYLTRDSVLGYMRDHGYDIGVTAWDTLIGTGNLPEPDRYVCSRPQWRPESIDAYINRDPELWPISRIAVYLGYQGPSATGSARKQLHRWGFTPAGRAPGRGGQSLYAADQIQAAHTHRPGRGRWAESRSDRPA